MDRCALCNQDTNQEKRVVRIWWDTSIWICYECWCTYRVDALLAPIRFMIESNRQYQGEDDPELVVQVDLIEACQQALNILNESPGHPGTKRVLQDAIERALDLIPSSPQGAE